MCARYTIHADAAELQALFGVEDLGDYRPRYNVAPTDPVLAIAEGRASYPRWGFKLARPGTRPTLLINARSETVHELPAFREAFRERRCLLPADGFFEWDAGKQPYHIHRPSDRPFALAGIWREARDGSEVCVLTTAANAKIARIHDRMPVILGEDDCDDWLAGPPEDLARLFTPFPDEELVLTPVTRRVGNVRFDHPDALRPEPSLFD